MKEDALSKCAEEVRAMGEQSRSEQTRAHLLQIADRIEAALRGEDPEVVKPPPIVVQPDPVVTSATIEEA